MGGANGIRLLSNINFIIPAKLVVTEKTGHVMSISINRPEVRNCVNVETADQLYEAFQEFERDDDAYVAVFYGKGEVVVITPPLPPPPTNLREGNVFSRFCLSVHMEGIPI